MLHAFIIDGGYFFSNVLSLKTQRFVPDFLTGFDRFFFLERRSFKIIRRTLIYVIKQLGSTNHILIFPLFKPFSSTLYSHSISCYSYYTPIYPMRINLSEDKTSFCFLYSRSKRCSAKSSLESSIISSLLSNLSISSDKWFSSTWVYKSIVICNVA